MVKRKRAAGVYDFDRGDFIIWWRHGIEAPQRGQVVSVDRRTGEILVRREFNRRAVKSKSGWLRRDTPEAWAEVMEHWELIMREHLAELEAGG